jgi:flagellar motility protein MotE (MotC chaperone)
MDYRTLDSLRRTHPAWRMLAAHHAPLVASFLHQYFIQPNTRVWPRQELASRLEDHLFHLREQLGDDAFPRPALHYLDEWAPDERAWLRKYYPANVDEPHYDLTPAAEKAIDWLVSLGQRHFVGTESRLMAVFELLRQLAEGTEVDPQARIAELEKRKAQIDADIKRIRDGQLFLMDATQVRDRFLLMAGTARGLLSDFREVEQNFRNLDRAVRARIAGWEEGKGALLQEIFGQRDLIADSDQGKSFRAFWDFLMSPARQEELSSLLQVVFALDAVQELAPDRRLLRIHYDWLEAGEVAQRTVARLSEQLRRYLDDQAWLENRRIMQIIRDVEQHALAIRDQPPEVAFFMPLDEPAPDIDLGMERPLYTPPFKPRFANDALVAGEADVVADALFDQVFVDKRRLGMHIRRALQTRNQISLKELVEVHPIEQGLAELVAYLSLAAEDRHALIADADTQTLVWTDSDGQVRQATLPLIIFNQLASDTAMFERDRSGQS